MTSSINLIKGDDNLDRDQHDDNKLKVQRPARIDNISESVGCFGYYSELPARSDGSRQIRVFKFISSQVQRATSSRL
ncbi:MAG: hypothetical protein KDJ71_08300 [Nitrobacter sp.]|nr:hypothetical protein [Nitrobacter sp.]